MDADRARISGSGAASGRNATRDKDIDRMATGGWAAH
jgi:hypothetical protein